jgi:retron-type reverse transcriptase
MKRISNLYSKIYDFENLYEAYLEARKGKRYRHDVMRFTANLEENLIQIQNELIYKTYKVGRYNEFFVYDPKKRLIMSLPFKDRVVQWAIYRQLNPLLDKRYISTSYGCRNGGGSHRAVAKLKQYIRAQPGTAYILKMDISKYFYRINHDVLMGILGRIIKDEDLLWLLETIIRSDHNFGIEVDDWNYTGERLSNVGMPIGNLSSQMFANLYLNGADHFAKEVLGCRHYIRYMDDVVIVDTDKQRLWEVLHAMDDYFTNKLDLKLNNKTSIRTETQGVDFCGYRVWRTHIRLRKKSAIKMKHRIKHLRKEFARGEIKADRFRNSLMSYLGMMQHCDSHALKAKLFENMVLTKGGK